MVVDKRIFHGNQITRLDDIKPGLKVRWNNVDFGPSYYTEEIIGEPFLRGGSLWVKVRDERDWEHDMSLSDMGVVPYLYAGGWNEKNWLERVVVLVPDLQPGDLFEMKSNYDKSPWWTYQVIEVRDYQQENSYVCSQRFTRIRLPIEERSGGSAPVLFSR